MTSIGRHSTTVVIPAFNESATIAGVIRSVKPFVDKIVVVDDGSSDSTGDEARAVGATVIRHEHNSGYDASLNYGIRFAFANGADIAVTFDADGQHASYDIPRMLKPIISGKADLVIAEPSGKKRLGEALFALYTSMRFGIRDPICGLKAYHKDVYQKIGHFDTLGSIGTQLTIEAVKSGFRLVSIPINLLPRQEGDGSRFYSKIFRGNLRILAAMVRVMLFSRSYK